MNQLEKAIEVENLYFGYGEEMILENVSFTIDKGDYIGVIGPNGSGKSTLIKMMLKILTPIKGEIKLFGESINKFNNWSKMGYVSQKANSFNSSFPATVEEVVGANILSKVGLFKRLDKQHKEKIEHALEIVGMKDYRKMLIGNLSGGQQQRVFIAKALVNEPEILFLDEPTVGVDAKSEEAVYCLLAELNKDLGITIVIISHDISAVTVHANKLACMRNKQVLIHDPKEESTHELIREMYGNHVNLHIHKHDCESCIRRNANA